MNTRQLVSSIALAASLGWAVPAQAQSEDLAAMRGELQAMQRRVETMAARIDTLEHQLAQARDAASQAQGSAADAAQVAQRASETAAKTAESAPKVAWKGAPELSGPNGFSFKPRGRLQVDVAGVDAPDGIAGNNSLGIGTEFRRAYLGVEGTLPGDFGYRLEADIANSAVDLTDVYLTYKPAVATTLTVGQHKPFWGLEELTSDLFTSFLERASFNSAFGFERRVGLSAQYARDALVVQAGVFTDNAADLNNDQNNSYSLDGRVVFAPRLAGGILHLGGSAHFRDFKDQSAPARYRARPFVHTTDLRLVDTRAIGASGERSFGGELAYIRGRLHATAEGHWITTRRPGLADPTFWGGYAEIGYLLTDDTTAYRGGVYDRIRPKHGVDKGGIGALQLNARYDRLDLNDAGIIGGKQQAAGVSLVWMPTDYVRLLVNYGRLWIDDAAVPAGADRNYAADALGMRAQVDF